MTPEEARDLHDHICAREVLDAFLAQQIAAALRDDEEAVRLELATAFRHDRDTRPVVLLFGRYRSPSGAEIEHWGQVICDFEAGGQERIYL